MSASEPADMATLRAALEMVLDNCVTLHHGDDDLDASADILTAALNELEKARERNAALEVVMQKIEQGLFATSLYLQCPICKGASHWTQDDEGMTQQIDHTLECPFEHASALLANTVAAKIPE